MYSYKLSLEAEEDIIRIFNYGFFRFGLKQANKYYDSLFESFDRIASNPFMFPEEIDFRGVDRFCVCGVDKIFYNVEGLEIKIITIVGRQDF